jgi:hypothetical protein
LDNIKLTVLSLISFSFYGAWVADNIEKASVASNKSKIYESRMQIDTQLAMDKVLSEQQKYANKSN